MTLDLGLQYSLIFINSISFRSQAAIVSEESTVFPFSSGFDEKMFDIVDDADDDDGRSDAGPWVYYKLTNEPSAQASSKGENQLKKVIFLAIKLRSLLHRQVKCSALLIIFFYLHVPRDVKIQIFKNEKKKKKSSEIKAQN